jgi:hypothetical protein
MRVRRTLLIGVSALAVALAAVAATRSATQPTRQADCGQTLVIVLFWPNGHRAIGNIGFPAHPRPHVDVYKYGKKGYPSKNFLLFASQNGHVTFSKTCKFASGPGPSGSFARKSIVRKARAFSCRVPTGGVERTKQIKGGIQFDLGAPGAHVLSAKLVKRGSTVDFSHSWCNSGKPPA